LASLNDLLAGAAHEINNPLTAILGYSDLIVETDQSREEQRASAEKIRHHARRTKALISDLLSFSRPDCSEKTLVHVDSLLPTALKLCQAGLSGRGIQIQLSTGGDFPPVLGNSAQLLQVFLHIIRNALDALEHASTPTLTVKTLQQAEYVIVEFSDNGPGLREPERVFDPFYTTKPVGQGTGLGLSASYGIVQGHRGRISCHNRSGGGATFRVELPAASTETDQIGERAAARAHAAANDSVR
jgi:two-component system NtrC family sensor kinase